MGRLRAPILSALILTAGACAIKPLPTEMGAAKYGVDVTWHGHSCFTLRDSVGRTVVLDPFDDTVGYGHLNLHADALLITHHHFDHDNHRAVHPRGKELDIFESAGSATVASGLVVAGIDSAHDDQHGEVNGPNTIFLFQMAGLRCVHLGDLGQSELTEYQRKIIGTVDVLFIPVGGVVTIDAKVAKHYVDVLKPGAVFPMHYGDIRFYPLDSVDKFAALFPPEAVRRLDGGSVRIRASDLTDKPIVYILTPQIRD